MPGRDRLLDHVLDGRLVDDRQHLLRLGLGGREEAGAQAGGGDDGLADGGHGAPCLLAGLRASTMRSSPRRRRSRLSRWRSDDQRRRTPAKASDLAAGPPDQRPPPPGSPTATATEPADAGPERPSRRRPQRRRGTSAGTGQEHDGHPGAGGHALAAAEPAGDRARRGRARPPARRPRPTPGRRAASPSAGGDGALGQVAEQHERAGPAAHRAEGVRRARVARALAGGVAALAPAHQDGGGERARAGRRGPRAATPRSTAPAYGRARCAARDGPTATLALSPFECQRTEDAVPTYEYRCKDCGERARGRPVVHRRRPHHVRGLRRRSCARSSARRHLLQGQRLLQERQPRQVRQPRPRRRPATRPALVARRRQQPTRLEHRRRRELRPTKDAGRRRRQPAATSTRPRARHEHLTPFRRRRPPLASAAASPADRIDPEEARPCAGSRPSRRRPRGAGPAAPPRAAPRARGRAGRCSCGAGRGRARVRAAEAARAAWGRPIPVLVATRDLARRATRSTPATPRWSRATRRRSCPTARSPRVPDDGRRGASPCSRARCCATERLAPPGAPGVAAGSRRAPGPSPSRSSRAPRPPLEVGERVDVLVALAAEAAGDGPAGLRARRRRLVVDVAEARRHHRRRRRTSRLASRSPSAGRRDPRRSLGDAASDLADGVEDEHADADARPGRSRTARRCGCGSGAACPTPRTSR